jgi:hypothetical protein
MISKMAAETAHLQEIARVQAAPGYKRPWWADGEYDEARAEECNDKGMELFAKKQFAAGWAWQSCFARRVKDADAVERKKRGFELRVDDVPGGVEYPASHTCVGRMRRSTSG